MRPKILISGGTGFIGKNIINSLKEKFIIYSLVRKKKHHKKKNKKNSIEFANYKDLKKKILKKKNIFAVVHCATKYLKEHNYQNINDIINSNISFGSHLLEISKIIGVKKFINLTTSWENFDNTLENPKNFYAVSKLSFKKILQYYSNKNFKTQYYNLYLLDTFGKGDTRKKLLPTLKKNILLKKNTYLISKNYHFNALNVKDLIEAIEIILNKDIISGDYSIINSKKFSLNNIALKLKKKTNIKFKYCLNKRINEDFIIFKKIPGWKPKFSKIDDLVNYLTNN